jgi:hypothetical protein
MMKNDEPKKIGRTQSRIRKHKITESDRSNNKKLINLEILDR